MKQEVEDEFIKFAVELKKRLNDLADLCTEHNVSFGAFSLNVINIFNQMISIIFNTFEEVEKKTLRG